MTKVTLFRPGTNVRRTGEIRDDNIVWNIAEAGSKFEALHQSEGDYVKEPTGHGGYYTNTWWVKIKVTEYIEGWVSAVRIHEGGNDESVPDVQEQDVQEEYVEQLWWA